MPEEGEPGRDDYIGLKYFGTIVVGPRQTVSLAEVWAAHRDAVLASWIDSKPGPRPRYWWELDALPAARRRLRRGEEEAEILDDLRALSTAERIALGLR